MRFEPEIPPASETTPLLVPPTSSEEPREDSQPYKPHFEWKKLVWLVSGIWSAVFLGALDGGYSLDGRFAFFLIPELPRDYRCNSRDSCKTSTEGLALHTITVGRPCLKFALSQIGSYFEQSYKAPYIGTSYLLSVCCFTPLYGTLSSQSARPRA